jgi:hypothetical protein
LRTLGGSGAGVGKLNHEARTARFLNREGTFIEYLSIPKGEHGSQLKAI